METEVRDGTEVFRCCEANASVIAERTPMRTGGNAVQRHLVLASVATAAITAMSGAPAQAADGEVAVTGAAVSLLPDDTRRLSVAATLDRDGVADGQLSFIHRSAAGLAHFTADVTCLDVRSGDEVTIGGVVRHGETTAGAVLDGRPVGFTVHLGDEQRFSLPRFAEDAQSCGGGRPETVEVTQAGLRIS